MIDVEIRPTDWEATGSESDPTSRLLSTITINGFLFHVEAYAVKYVGDDRVQEIDDTTWAESFEVIYKLLGDACAQSQEIEIDGVKRDYVLVAFPYGE